MSVWNSRGRRRAVGRRIAPFLLILASSALFIVCLRVLWLAYATHSIFMPLRSRGRYVTLEQEPAFFWISVAVYLIIVVCVPIGVGTDVSDIRFAAWLRKKRAR